MDALISPAPPSEKWFTSRRFLAIAFAFYWLGILGVAVHQSSAYHAYHAAQSAWKKSIAESKSSPEQIQFMAAQSRSVTKAFIATTELAGLGMFLGGLFLRRARSLFLTNYALGGIIITWAIGWLP